MSEKICDIEGCNNTFRQKSKGRGRITKKKDKGEMVSWICPSHMKELDEKIEWRQG
jgi:hypothetical protein